jgi:hypothetical protein
MFAAVDHLVRGGQLLGWGVHVTAVLVETLLDGGPLLACLRGRRVMSSSERDKRLRAELAAELGWYPADLDDESIARHRADAARKKTDRDPAKKWAHLTELARQRDVEAARRAAVADLYE